ncbi:hypothetical protein AOG23_20110 [Rhizobium acidisoli]|nr:hypothetical protein AOG23_20110 [Rhizobium acidisoli]
MLGLDQSIHAAPTGSRGMDPRVKPEDDGERGRPSAKLVPASPSNVHTPNRETDRLIRLSKMIFISLSITLELCER